jgi:hypothetical protein
VFVVGLGIVDACLLGQNEMCRYWPTYRRRTQRG